MNDIVVGDIVKWDFNDNNVGTVREIRETHVLVRFDDGFGVWAAKTELTRVSATHIAIKERA